MLGSQQLRKRNQPPGKNCLVSGCVAALPLPVPQEQRPRPGQPEPATLPRHQPELLHLLPPAEVCWEQESFTAQLS